MTKNTFDTRALLTTASGQQVQMYRINTLEEDGIASMARLPFSIKILLESLLRNEDGHVITRDDITALANWGGAGAGGAVDW